MIKPEQVPDAVVFAMQDCMKDPEASPWDWIAAALNAWPGADARIIPSLIRDDFPALILPLTQEPANG